MIRHLAPVPLSRRNVCLLHQKSPRHDQLTPARLTGTLGEINRLSRRGGEKCPEEESPKLEETRSVLPPSFSHLSSRFARRCYLPPFFSLLLQHTFPSVGFTLQNVGGRTKSNASEQVSPLRCVAGQVRIERHLTVCGCGSRDGETKTHGTPITHTHEST